MVVAQRIAIWVWGVDLLYHFKYFGVIAGVAGGEGGRAVSLFAVMGVRGVRGCHGGARAESGDLWESKHGVCRRAVRLIAVGERTMSTPLQERVRLGGT
jgi:hypothetical protein